MCGADYLMKLARFEQLTYAEQKIYMQNGGMALEVRPIPNEWGFSRWLISRRHDRPAD